MRKLDKEFIENNKTLNKLLLPFVISLNLVLFSFAKEKIDNNLKKEIVALKIV